MLHQSGQAHPGVKQRGDDLAKAMVPLMRHVLLEDDIGLDVGSALVPDAGFLPLEVRVLEDEQAVGARVLQRPEDRMSFADEQPSTGTEQPGDHVSPPADVGQPAERPDPGEHEVEGTLT